MKVNRFCSFRKLTVLVSILFSSVSFAGTEGYQVLIDLHQYTPKNIDFLTQSINSEECFIEAEMVHFVDFRDIPGVEKDGVAVVNLYSECPTGKMLQQYYSEKTNGNPSFFHMIAPQDVEAE